MGNKSNQLKEIAASIVSRLNKAGFEAYLVGGCVRDLVMQKTPKDYDIATSATPEQIISLFPKTVEIGKAFGVVTVVEDHNQFEVATFRSEGLYSDGRRPDQVTFTTAKEDVLRRDFTINGLLFDFKTSQVIDYVEGQKDLQQKIIRTIGDPEKRFTEDKLRMLRAIKFACRLGFNIEPNTWAALKQHSKEITQISAERIRYELQGILTEGQARRGFELLDESTLLEHILPEALQLKGVEQPPEFHPEGDVWVHTLMMLEGLDHPSPELAWAVLLHDIAKPQTFTVRGRIRFDGHDKLGAEMAETILKRLKCSNETIERASSLIAQHLRFKDAPNMRTSKLKRFLRQEHFDEHLALHRLDCLSSHRILDLYEFCKKKLTELPPEEIKPPRLITGQDLIQLGFTPGPLFSKILTEVETEQLEGTLKTKDEAIAFVKNNYLNQPK
ncbi:MAG TPA: HD domain-containing protein [Bdellovibrionota bacterium]|nr:HD domain-containing protein [Bdellovibrionota bacterium]